MELNKLRNVLIVLAVLVTSVTAGFRHCTSSLDCVENASCEYDECVCNEGYSGNGSFYCVDDANEYFCRVLNDPGLETYAGEKTIFYPVASTILTQFNTKRIARYGGEVYVTLSAWTLRYNGKMYYKGTELLLEQTLPNGTYDAEIIQLIACANSSGYHTWTIQTKKPDNSTFSLEATVNSADSLADSAVAILRFGCDIDFQRGLANFYHVQVVCANFKYGIRAFQPGLDPQMPGIYMTMNKNCRLDYANWTKPPVCLNPDLKFDYVEDYVGLYGDIPGAVSLLSIINGGTVDYELAPSKLKKLQWKLCKCPKDKRNQMIAETNWSLKEPLFINCISQGGPCQDRLVTFLLKLARWYCKDRKSACESTKDLIENRCSDIIGDYPLLQAYYESSCDITPAPSGVEGIAAQRVSAVNFPRA